MFDDFEAYMGMKKVVIGPDGNPYQEPATGSIRSAWNSALPTVAATTIAIASVVPATGANPVDALKNSLRERGSYSVQEGIGLPERVAYCRYYFSLNMKQVADVLRVERPTVYAWISGERKPHASNESRLNALFRLADSWARRNTTPVGRALTQPLSRGKTLLEMLTEEELNIPALRVAMDNVRAFDGSSLVAKSGEERFNRTRALGYTKQSRAASSARLRRNLAV